MIHFGRQALKNTPQMLAVVMVLTATLACTVFLGGPAYPVVPPADPQQAPDFAGRIASAAASAALTGEFTLDITQAELTSYLRSQLGSQSNPVLSDPEVELLDGLMIIHGRAQMGILQANVKITTELTVDENGTPQIKITQADFGPLPAPRAVREAVGSLLRETLTGPFGPAAIGFRLESIAVTDGIMTVRGRLK